MSDGPLDETWEAWTARIAADLAALEEDDWLTFTVHVPSHASSAYAADAGSAADGARSGAAAGSGRPTCPTSSCRCAGSRACSRSSASATRSSRA